MSQREETPRARLAPHLRKPKWAPNERCVARTLPPREVLTVKKLDVTAPSARPREIEISLWRIKAGEVAQ